MSKEFIAIFILITVNSAASQAGPRQDRAVAAGATWRDCVVGRASRYATQNEPAETLARAAFAACVSQEMEFRTLLKESTREYGLPFTRAADPESLDNAHAEVRQKLTERAIATIIDARAAAGK